LTAVVGVFLILALGACAGAIAAEFYRHEKPEVCEETKESLRACRIGLERADAKLEQIEWLLGAVRDGKNRKAMGGP
jgi:hypothetical protein